jgi:hypothetical protein
VTGRRSLALPALATLLAVAPAALAFTVEVGEIVGLRDVEVTATALDRSTVLKLVNRESTAADCELRIDSGPDERVRRVIIPPLSTKIVNQSIRPNTQRVRISGSCS